MEPIETEASLDRDPGFDELRVKKQLTSAARQNDMKLANGFVVTSCESPMRMPRS